MDQRKVLILAGVLGVLLLIIIIGTVAYISSSRSTSPQNTQKIVTSSPLPIPSTATSGSNPAGSVSNTKGNFKTYSGTGFSVRYPKTWGLLTCSNSKDFEFDPVNGTDQLKVVCNKALKPITVIVHTTPVSCLGSKQTFGSVTTTKAVDSGAPFTDYRYCTQTTPQLDISTRYSPNGGTAVATTDYSSQVEQLISNVSFGGGS